MNQNILNIFIVKNLQSLSLKDGVEANEKIRETGKNYNYILSEKKEFGCSSHRTGGLLLIILEK